MIIRILDGDWHDVYEAMDWYETQQADLGRKFIEHVNAAMQEIMRDPDRLPRFDITRKTGTLRRFTLTEFPYSIVFVRANDEVVDCAVAHLNRRPFYWKKRIT